MKNNDIFFHFILKKVLTNKKSYGIIYEVLTELFRAGMAELADAPDLESGVARREGSSPFTRTIIS